MSIYSKKFGTHSYKESNTSLSKILKEIKPTDKQILDIGCSSGYLDRLIKEKFQTTITGIEIDTNDAKKAKNIVDQIYVCNVESFDFSQLKTKYDLIILADVLEHLAHPDDLLDKLHRIIKPNGRIIVSLPNFQHYSVIIRILANNWHYDEFGLLDQTHLKFFTYDTMVKLFQKQNFYIKNIDFTTSSIDYKILPHEVIKNQLPFTLAFSPSIFPSETFIFQYLITLSPRRPRKYQNYIDLKGDIIPIYPYYYSIKSLGYSLYLKTKFFFNTI